MGGGSNLNDKGSKVVLNPLLWKWARLFMIRQSICLPPIEDVVILICYIILPPASIKIFHVSAWQSLHVHESISAMSSRQFHMLYMS